MDREKAERDCFSAAITWFFADKPYGTQRAICIKYGKPAAFISQIVSQKKKNAESRRFLCDAIGVPYDAMLAAGEAILAGNDPGPPPEGTPPEPLKKREPTPAIPGGTPFRKVAPKRPQTGRQPSRPRHESAPATFRRIPLAIGLRLTRSIGNLPEIPIAYPAADSPVSVPEALLKGTDPEKVVAFLLDSDDMEPSLRKHDAVIVDTGQITPPSGGPGELFMITSGPEAMSCYPRICFRPDASSPDVMAYTLKPESVPPKLRNPENVRIIGKIIRLHRDFESQCPD
jgi:hypothetical protein